MTNVHQSTQILKTKTLLNPKNVQEVQLHVKKQEGQHSICSGIDELWVDHYNDNLLSNM